MFITLFMGMLSYSLFHYDDYLSRALLVSFLFAIFIELLIIRNMAIIIIAILTKIWDLCTRKKGEAYKEGFVDVSKGTESYKKLFKKYPRWFVTADVRAPNYMTEDNHDEGDPNAMRKGEDKFEHDKDDGQHDDDVELDRH